MLNDYAKNFMYYKNINEVKEYIEYIETELSSYRKHLFKIKVFLYIMFVIVNAFLIRDVYYISIGEDSSVEIVYFYIVLFINIILVLFILHNKTKYDKIKLLTTYTSKISTIIVNDKDINDIMQFKINSYFKQLSRMLLLPTSQLIVLLKNHNLKTAL